MPAINLPLRHVALFSSGVGFFSRAATLVGAGECELLFKEGDINDILKSLVLLDPQGGARHVSYDSKEEIQKYLHEAGLDLAPNTSLANILRQFQGVPIRLQTFDSRTLEGRLVSVHTRISERKTVRDVGEQNLEKLHEETLSIMGSQGLQPVSLDDIAALQVLDEARQRDLEQALSMLGAERGGGRRAVTIHFGGAQDDKSEAEDKGENNEREVRISYGHEVPLWKTSYRLVLGESAPFLQGWAIVENTTEEDWEAVDLSLVAGRPISFVQDLYSPLHAHRPTVAPQIVQSPLPQLYEQVLEAPPAADLSLSEVAFAGAPSPAPAMAAKRSRQMSAAAMEMSDSDTPHFLRRESGGSMAAAEMASAEPAAQGGERGELFEYSIAHPVSIARRQAALVPIVGGAIEGEKLSIYNPAVFPRPLRGFLLKNTSGVHLAGGPLTVFDDELYAGDAQISDVTIGDERLISYAVDLDLIASHRESTEPGVHIALKASCGVLYYSMKLRRVTRYEFRNSGSRARMVLIQRPLDDWEITAPTFEKTPSEVRFRVPVEPGANVKFQVMRQKMGATTVHLGNTDDSRLLEIATDKLASPALSRALKELAEMKKAESIASRREQALEQELETIATDQERIRANMTNLDHKSALYNQYVSKLSAQEKRIERAHDELESARADVSNAQQRVSDFISNFNFE